MDQGVYAEADRYRHDYATGSRMTNTVDPENSTSGTDNYAATQYPNNASASLGNGVVRTASKRRTAGNTSQSGGSNAPPAAPDAPQSSRPGPATAFYEPSYNERYARPDKSQSTKSFSARAGVGKSYPDNSPGIAEEMKGPRIIEVRRYARRTSATQPDTANPAETAGPTEPTYTSFAGLPPPQESAYADPNRRKSTGQRTKQPFPGESSKGTRAVGAMPIRSSTTRTSAGSPSDWAADRSPLQKLEVKLNDISKEEKRARVQEAEQRLKEKRASVSSRRASQGVDPPMNRSSSQRAVSAGNEPLQRPERARAYPDVAQNRFVTGKEPFAQRSSASKALEQPQIEKPRIARESGYASSKDEKSRGLGNQVDVPKAQLPTRPRRSLDGRVDDRAVRFSDDEIPPDAKVSSLSRLRSVSGNAPNVVPAAQAPARAKPVEDTGIAKDVNSHGSRADSDHHHFFRSHADGLKHKLPPQTTAGIQARQRIGFGGDNLDNYPQNTSDPKHHLGILHRNKPQPELPQQGPVRHLEEWRQGQTARLTLADAIAPANESPKEDTSKAWWEKSRHGSQRRKSAAAEVETTAFDGTQEDLNGLKREINNDDGSTADKETWRGSVMIVTTDQQSVYNPAPVLRLSHQPMKLLPPPPQQYDESNEEPLPSEYVDPVAGLPKMTRTGGTVYVKPAEDLDDGRDVSRVENDDGLYEVTRTANVPTLYGKADEFLDRSPAGSNGKGSKRASVKKSGRYREVVGIRLHAERGVTFWRFNLEVELGDKQTRIAYRINKGAPIGFWIPAKGQSMNIMFQTCNGFSMNVDPNTFSGPDPLWRDVLNAHQMEPFHVMIGGGDQIYNDCVVKQTRHFQEWIEMKSPHHKNEAPFTPEIQEELETFYLERYSMWFSQGLFGMANAQIPMINIWDDHDIIDGYGSYPHDFMSTPIFCGLGNVAFKYYMLFQHQSVPNELEADEPSWLLGSGPGPYINELSRSVFMFLGRKIAFLGLDCRTERTRDEILSEDTYHLALDRCRREIIQGETKHLIVLLGIPIAYPRLVWLETVLTSRALDPLKALGRMGLLGNLMNKFDGGVEILDDLDDHWTAKNHKEERNWFVEELQMLAAEKSVRVTILSGDVHLAAVGQFYSNKNLGIRKDKDHRYMPNVISSAIVNTPPPDVMADVLNRREKVHHLNHETDEDMIPMFTHDVDGKPRNNKRLMPKRNWCSITEYAPGSTPPPTPPELSPSISEEFLPPKAPGPLQRTLSLTRGDSAPAKLIRRLSLSQKPKSYAEQSPSPPPDRMSLQNQNTGKRDEVPVAKTEDDKDFYAPIPIRPISQFHRQPTNLEKAAAKGGGDPHQVNLELGLDVKLHCEIKKGDPSGVTESYRLLVPALFYEDEHVAEPPQRRPSLIKRWTSRRGSRAAEKQGQGNWGQSDSDDEVENSRNAETQPRYGSGNDLTRPGIAYDQSQFGQRPQSQEQMQTQSYSQGLRSLIRGNTLLRKSRPFSISMPGSNKPEPFQPRPAQQSRELPQDSPPPQIQPKSPLRQQQPFQQQQQQPQQQQQYHQQFSNQPQTQPQQYQYSPPPNVPVRRRPVPQQQPQSPQQVEAPVVHNSTAPLPADDLHSDREGGSEDGDEDYTEDEDFSDDPTPRRRVASKFDRSGASKFFGTRVPVGKSGAAGPQNGSRLGNSAGNGYAGGQDARRRMSAGDYSGGEGEGGYSGIEAYKGDGKKGLGLGGLKKLLGR